MKNYIYKGHQYQFEDGKAPAGAVEVKAEIKKVEVEEKAVKPKNKSKKVSNK